MSEQKSSAPAKRTFWYTLARIFAVVLFHTVCPVRYHHRERADFDAPCIVIANHFSWFDPVIVAAIVRRYEIVFLGKKELTSSAIGRFLLTRLHMIAVDRHHTDMAAMRACLRVTREGGVLGIFPEGTRHHRGVMEELEGGVGLIALRSGVPLIPFYIDRKLAPFRVTHVDIGQPIPYDDLRAEGINAETCDKLMARISSTYSKGFAD